MHIHTHARLLPATCHHHLLQFAFRSATGRRIFFCQVGLASCRSSTCRGTSAAPSAASMQAGRIRLKGLLSGDLEAKKKIDKPAGFHLVKNMFYFPLLVLNGI